MENIGIDVHKRESQICIVTEQGEVFEQRIRTDRARFAEVLGKRCRAKILIEASTESEWVARCLEGLGHEVVVADPNFAAMYATRSRKVKTDKRDARTLAEACRLGAYRPAHRTSDARRHLKAQLAAREALVQTRAKFITMMGAFIRGHGLRVGTGSAAGFLDRLEKVELPGSIKSEVGPLMAVMLHLNKQIEFLDSVLEEVAKKDVDVGRLCTVPSVGPVTAAAFVAVLDDAQRFKGPHQVEAYLGLVPSERSSGETQRKGRITKAGNGRVRWLLVQVAVSMMRLRNPATTALRKWAEGIATRRGRKTAMVALARRLAGILFALMRDGSRYVPRRVPIETQPVAA